MDQNKKPKQTMQEKLNTLRAGVLGANDGILTVVGVLVSVAAATTDQFTIFIAGLSDLLACAFSMASGEYASVSTQKDTENQPLLMRNICSSMTLKAKLSQFAITTWKRGQRGNRNGNCQGSTEQKAAADGGTR